MPLENREQPEQKAVRTELDGLQATLLVAQDPEFTEYKNYILEFYKDDPEINQITQQRNVLEKIIQHIPGTDGSIDQTSYTTSGLKKFLDSLPFEKERTYDLLEYFLYHESNEWILFQHLPQYQDQPYAQHIFEGLIKRTPQHAIDHKDKFISKSYARELIEVAFKEDVERIMQQFSVFADQLRAKEFLLTHLEYDGSESDREKKAPYPLPVIRYIDQYKTEAYAAEVLQEGINSLKGGPFRTLACFDQYADQPYAKTILHAAIAEDNPPLLFAYTSLYKTLKTDPGEQTLITERLQEGINKDPFETLRYAEKHKTKEKEETTRTNDQKRFRNAYIGTTYSITSASTTQKVTLTPAGVENMKFDIQFTDDNIRSVFGMYPDLSTRLGYFMQYRDIIGKLPAAKDVLLGIARRDPTIVLAHFATYQNEPYAADILKTAITQDASLIKKILFNPKYAPLLAPLIESIGTSDLLSMTEKTDIKTSSPVRYELLQQHPKNIGSLLMYLQKTPPPVLRIGTKEVPITLTTTNLISGILYTQEQSPDTADHPFSWSLYEDDLRKKVIQTYQSNLQDFLAANKEVNQAAEQGEQPKKTGVVLFAYLKKDNAYDGRDQLLQHYQTRYTSCEDLMPENDSLPFQTLYDKVEETLKKHKKEKTPIIVDIWAHGRNDGSVDFGSEKRTKEQFNPKYSTKLKYVNW